MEEEKHPIIVFFTNLFSAIKLPFPPQKNGAKIEPAGASSEAVEPIEVKPAVDLEDENSKPGVVTFPRQSFAPVKLEAEGEESERSTNPVVLWQVYAIGGFFILRWAWTRWNERKGQKKKSGDEPPPPPAHD